ncbi:UdgX family uracil-DNA binding protein [Cereibacter changlensis]|uniref:UdgX family uracil-DNA binding protein n=1 Tax=Cereibacter changlensis TaxID=402884 RepID=UPI004033E549
MRAVVLPRLGTVAAWRKEARELAQHGVPAETVTWRVGDGEADLFAAPPAPLDGPTREIRLPREAVSGLQTALCHSDPERFARGYAVLLALSEGRLRWGDRANAAMRKILEQEKSVRRDIHKMHAFVRFRELPPQEGRRAFGAWFEPEHHIVEAATPFFAKRFGDMDWVIATPEVTAHFIDGALSFTETEAESRPPEDATEALWRTYYTNIFNPARLMVKAMQSEMPKKYWKNLPEADLIPGLIRGAQGRAAEMQARMPTEPPKRREAVARMLPQPEQAAAGSLEELHQQAEACTRCPLHGPATQVVFGEGPPDAALMIVGEQPGDREDLMGRPFVGPAGQLFDEEAEKAGLDRRQVYVTNAVKHFKFAPRGKRRIHFKPDAGEVTACRWWLDLERERVKPKLIVAMGATACLSITGSGANLLKRRGQFETAPDGTPVFVTVHPSYILRLPEEAKAAERQRFCDDLKTALASLA